MQKVLILGAGKIGALVSGFLAECRDYEVHVADVNGNAANSVVAAHGLPNLHACELDASNPALLEAHLREHPADTIISSLPFYCNVKVAEIARKVNAHYFDLTEDVAVTRSVRKTAEGSTRAFVPQCGLAPGFHQHCGERADPALRRDPQCQVARRRPAPASEQRAQVLADLVHRRPDQRVRQSV